MCEIEVVFGLGSGKGMHMKSAVIAESLQEALKQTITITRTKQMFSKLDLSGRTKVSQMFSRSKTVLNSGKKCNFEVLSYDVHIYSMAIMHKHRQVVGSLQTHNHAQVAVFGGKPVPQVAAGAQY
jgi:hypothetical protein